MKIIMSPWFYFPFVFFMLGFIVFEILPKIHNSSVASHKHMGTVINPKSLNPALPIDNKAVTYINHNGIDTIIYPHASIDLDSYNIGATICFRHTNENNSNIFIEFTSQYYDILPSCYFHLLNRVPSQK